LRFQVLSVYSGLVIPVRFRALILCLLFAAAQLGGVLHDADIGSHGDEDPCTVCIMLSAGGDDSLAPTGALSWPDPFHERCRPGHLAVIAGAQNAPAFHIRAPPALI
jgi:hypothetical protein